MATSTGDTVDRRHRVPTQTLFGLLLAFRIVNALTIKTFFQPDEYFQSLEPAWQIAFGQDSGAWITWEWKTQLRSSLHPAILAAVYRAAASCSKVFNLGLPLQADLYIAAPKVLQAVFAASLDCYTWKLAESVYGQTNSAAWVTLALSLSSPWQWFCSTRSLSNSLETALTSIAIYHWPWRSLEPSDVVSEKDRDFRHRDRDAEKDFLGPLARLRLALLLAALACILRPTNLLIWLCVSIPTLARTTTGNRFRLFREALICGSAILTCSIISDRLYFQTWTLPPFRFLYFNVVQSLAVFYGRNRSDYYLTEGLPLLLTTALPFALLGTWQVLRGKATANQSPGAPTDATAERVLSRLAWTCVSMSLALSLISHKEVRFLYPILPFLHVLAARPLASFLTPFTTSRKAIIALLLLLNIIIAGYVSQVHQRGVIDVLHFLRHEHENRTLQEQFDKTLAINGRTPKNAEQKTTVGFLMPCHSTPWRSHLVYPNIDAWALTCEPPIDIPLHERDQYLDEADQFYVNPGPQLWLERHMPAVRSISKSGNKAPRHRIGTPRRPWPEYLVFFEQLEPTMSEFLKDSRYEECWRGFNTHFHDDSRRRGDVIVWRLLGRGEWMLG